MLTASAAQLPGVFAMNALGQFCAGTGKGNTAQYTARACIDGIDANAEYVGCRDVLKTVFAPHQAHN